MQTFQQTNENSADSAALLPKLYHCTHCGEFVGKTERKFCDDCTVASKRQEMCQENILLNPKYGCHLCGIYGKENKSKIDG